MTAQALPERLAAAAAVYASRGDLKLAGLLVEAREAIQRGRPRRERAPRIHLRECGLCGVLGPAAAAECPECSTPWIEGVTYA